MSRRLIVTDRVDIAPHVIPPLFFPTLVDFLSGSWKVWSLFSLFCSPAASYQYDPPLKTVSILSFQIRTSRLFFTSTSSSKEIKFFSLFFLLSCFLCPLLFACRRLDKPPPHLFIFFFPQWTHPVHPSSLYEELFSPSSSDPP